MARRTLASLLPASIGAVVLAASHAGAAPIPSPESVLGFKVGEDRKLADWEQIVGYFQRLDAASPRVSVADVGKTTEGLPFLVVTISSEANMARLEEIRRANLRLADPRRLSQEDASRLIADGRTIVALNHGIHSTEVAASQTSMETAYGLATRDDPQTRAILDATVILMLPSHNPDGTQRVVEWYRKSLGTPWEGGAIPFLYQKYVGHDNNRDWYMFTQIESRLTLEHLYDRWRPQIVHDLHQMGARAARIFAPPYVDPWEPNVDPALRAANNAIGTHMAARLTGEGRAGVVVHALYDGWSPARAYPHTHGGVRILTECASARMATPLETRFEALDRGIGYDAKRVSWNHPNPWPGGSWRLRDIVDYQLSATRALLEHAAAHRGYWLQTFHDVLSRAATRSDLYAFVLPARQLDPLAAARLLRVLRTGGVELQRARAAFAAGGQDFAAGSHVILMRQPFSAFAKSLLERQHYPDLRQYPGGPPQRPYDVTAHTLPLLLGVDVRAVREAFSAELEPLDSVGVTPGEVEAGSGAWLAFGHRNGDLVALSRLLKAGVPVRWAVEAFSDGGRSFPAGTLLAAGSARARLEPLARELGLRVQPVRARPRGLRLRPPRVGLYQSWVASMDEGWTRFIFEKEVEVAYQTLHDADIRGGGLRARFDAIVLPDQAPAQTLDGHREGALPKEYTGGLGRQGLEALSLFAREGGTLIALDSASDLLIQELRLPLTNALAAFARGARSEESDAQDSEASAFYCPGSLLEAKVEGHSPLAHGLDETAAVWFEHSPAFETAAGGVVLRYPQRNPLLSGWLLGDTHLHGKAALVELPVGRGRAVLFGFRPQYRAQSWATYIPLLNAIYTSAASAD